MRGLDAVVTVLGVDVAAVALGYLALGRGRLRHVAFGLSLASLACAPLLAGGTKAFPRFLLALVSIVFFVKLYDLRIGLGHGVPRPALASFLAFLPNVFGLVHRALDSEPAPPAPVVRRNLFVGLAGQAIGLALAVGVFAFDWTEWPLFIEHPSKVIALYGALLPLDIIGLSLWRLAGGRGRRFMRQPYLARTPAEFWRRYNRPVNQFLELDVFRRSGARSSPFLATMAAFAVSALVHEYLFAVSIGHVEPFQTAFFMVQGLGVAVTSRWKPNGPWARLGIGLTWIYNLTTSLLFFASMGGVVPFYSPGRPWWLRPRI